MQRVIGIDLGTTNSYIATLDDNLPKIIPSVEGKRYTPSVVAFTDDGEILVGIKAKNQAITNHSKTITSIKRKMGSKYSIKINDKTYSPEEISAMILLKLKHDAEKYLNEEIKDVVITVPAYFTDAMRQATKDAGKIAGLNVLRIINEPTAAALAYGINKNENATIMVFDFGGGTLDVSILDIKNGIIEVLATSGNNQLGGDDFDLLLTNHIIQKFKKDYLIDLRKDLNAMCRIYDACEKAKIELSSSFSAIISLPFIYNNKGNVLNLEYTITKDEFDLITKDLLKKAKEPILQAIKDSKINLKDLSKVLMVGGTSRIPSVVKVVKEITNLEPFIGINPNECVALGAAIECGVLEGKFNDLLLLDVTPLSLGVMTTGDKFSKIIDRNSLIPISKSQIFTTASHYQSNVEIQVLQGENPRASANKLLGKFILNKIKRAPAGTAQIEVTFNIDVNGIVFVTAKDLATGNSNDITIKSSSNLSNDEIAKAINDAKSYEENEKERSKKIELLKNARIILKQAELKIKENKKIKKEILPIYKKLRKSLNKRDYDNISNYIEKILEYLK